jgi:hypothetical protein
MEYRVSWEIDVDADSPEEAAREAFNIMKAPDHFPYFDVRPIAGGETVGIDTEKDIEG